MRTIRCSRLPLTFACPASLYAETPINESGEAAALGTAVHAGLAPLVRTGSIDWDGMPDLARRHGVSVDELRAHCGCGAKLWEQVKESFPRAMTEVPVSAEVIPGLTLTGHIDLISVAGSIARIGDWKDGLLDSDYIEQVYGYGVLVLILYPELTEVSSTLLWTRSQEVEHYTITRDDSEAWVERLHSEVVNWDGVYHPGAHCEHCPRTAECGASKALVRRAVGAFLDPSAGEMADSLATMPPETLVELAERAKVVGGLAERVRTALREHVMAHGDVVGGGSRLTIETQNKRKLDPEKTWPVLEGMGFRDAEFCECVSISMSDVESIVANRAGRGKGAAAKRALKEQLEAAGAISTTEIRKLVTMRAS
jgi:hypothetical protein